MSNYSWTVDGTNQRKFPTINSVLRKDGRKYLSFVYRMSSFIGCVLQYKDLLSLLFTLLFYLVYFHVFFLYFVFFNQDFEKILKYSKQFSDDTYWLDIKILIDWSLIMRMMSKMLDELKIHDDDNIAYLTILICIILEILFIFSTFLILFY